jgi:hypothetical protein
LARAGRAAARAEAMLIDLWINEAGDTALRPIARSNLAASARARAGRRWPAKPATISISAPGSRPARSARIT